MELILDLSGIHLKIQDVNYFLGLGGGVPCGFGLFPLVKLSPCGVGLVGLF
jgi:hypothetical protein